MVERHWSRADAAADGALPPRGIRLAPGYDESIAKAIGADRFGDVIAKAIGADRFGESFAKSAGFVKISKSFAKSAGLHIQLAETVRKAAGGDLIATAIGPDWSDECIAKSLDLSRYGGHFTYRVGEAFREALSAYQTERLASSILHEVGHAWLATREPGSWVKWAVPRLLAAYGSLALESVGNWLEFAADQLEDICPDSKLPYWLRKASHAVRKRSTEVGLATRRSTGPLQTWLGSSARPGSPGRRVSNSPRKARGPNPQMDIDIIHLREAAA